MLSLWCAHFPLSAAVWGGVAKAIWSASRASWQKRGISTSATSGWKSTSPTRANIWAIGKTSIEKCDLGAKLSYFCTSSVVWAGHDVYPTTESLDDLHAYRTGIHHHVMYTTPSLSTMLLHIIWFPGYRFWDFTIYRFTYQDAYVYIRERSNTYLLHGEFSLLLISTAPKGLPNETTQFFL